jgi:EmrB/QacA subfamily drug resistance transporter
VIQPTVGAPPAVFSHREILEILSGILLGMMLAALDQMAVGTALPTIAAELHGAEHLSWIVAAYLLTSTATTPIYGKLSDLYGRRLLLQIAIAIFVVASALCGLTQTMAELIGARALQGLGGGGLICMAQAVIADVVSPRERSRYQAYFASVWAISSVSGPIMGGLFVDYLSWRWVFWINLPIGIGAYVLCQRALRKLAARRIQRPIDYAGAVLLMSAVTALLLVASWGGTEYAWLSAEIVGLALLGLVLLAAFVLRELGAPEPILPLRVFRNAVIRVAAAMSFVVAMAMFAATVFLPIYLQLVAGVSPSASGMLLVPLMTGSVVGGFSAGQLMGRSGRYKRYPIVGLLVASAAFALLATLSAASPASFSLACMGVLGIGIGMTMPVTLVAAQNAADPRDIGTVTSAVAFFRSMGGSFGVAILWTVLLLVLDRELGPAASGSDLGAGGLGIALLHGGPEAIAHMPPDQRAVVLPVLTHAFHVVFWSGAGLALICFLLALCLPEIPLRTTPAGRAAAPSPRATPAVSPER